MNPRPSIRDLTPPDFGGTIARRGFAYQDHVAVHFCLLMTVEPSLSEVWCETYDDIVLIWNENGQETVEFVQVKSEALNQLWSVAKLCERSAALPKGEGTSIIERSLARDACKESTLFRLVTCRPFKSDIDVLTLERCHQKRGHGNPDVVVMCDAIHDKVGDIQSPNGNDHKYWVANTQLECHEQDAMKNSNRVRLLSLLNDLGVSGSPDVVESLYEEMLAIAKAAAECPPTEMCRKMIKKGQLRSEIRRILDPYPALRHDERLETKMTCAGLDTVAIETAKELRRHYRREDLDPKFLDATGREYFRSAVLAGLLELRSDLDSGAVREDGIRFHKRCVDAMRTVSASRPAEVREPPAGYLHGCMYEITARCKHRFVKQSG